VIDRDDLGFLLAKATQRWNELLAERFAAAGYGDIRASYGSVLVPLFEENGLRMGELARRSRLSKQTMTQLVRRLEQEGLVERRADAVDGRASLIFLTARSRAFEPVAAEALGELDRLVRERLDDEQVEELKAALRELLALGREAAMSSGPASGLK
jgi:DNA-binding MarR family transcriptional regulator